MMWASRRSPKTNPRAFMSSPSPLSMNWVANLSPWSKVFDDIIGFQVLLRVLGSIVELIQSRLVHGSLHKVHGLSHKAL